MGCIPETEIVERMRLNNVSRKELVNHFNWNYSTLVSWLNGFSKLPDYIRYSINDYIDRKALTNSNKPLAFYD